MRIYAVGDIHGQLEGLRVAHRRIAEDRARTGDAAAPVVHLGDLIAKGPDSAGVIALLREGQARGEPWAALKGNHEAMLLTFLADPAARHPGMRAPGRWIDPQNGGDTVLASFGVEAPAMRPLAQIHTDALAAIPQAIRDWIGALPTAQLTRQALFVHAGIRPGVDLGAQSDTDLMFIRKPFQTDPRDHGVLVVHGHTPARHVRHHGNRINIDSDAAKGGPVSAIVLDDGAAFLLTDGGRVPLRPGDAILAR